MATISPVTLIEPLHASSPLVVDSPHSGRDYPADFHFTCPASLLRMTEDFLVDELISGATESGAALVIANFPRSYIDANRAEDDIDPTLLAEGWPVPLNPTERTPHGLGLVRRLCAANLPVYAAPLSTRQIRDRIEHFYRPYHAALEEALDEKQALFGTACLLDFHSMPSRSPEDPNTLRPDFVLGDRSGTTCDAALTERAANLLRAMGYDVAINYPYQGMEIVRRHGQPAKGRHALQIEINRGLYMDETRWHKADGFVSLRDDLTQFFHNLARVRTKAEEPLIAAAE